MTHLQTSEPFALTKAASPCNWVASLRRLLEWWDGLDRPFKRLSRLGSIVLLIGFATMMVWSAAYVEPIQMQTQTSSDISGVQVTKSEKDGDLDLYKKIADRVAAGEDYYTAATSEQRANNYPTRPFFTVRQPTLAWMQAVLGLEAVRLVTIGLLIACMVAFQMRMARSITKMERAGGLVLIILGGAASITPAAGLAHEIMAGLLLTFAFVSYDPKRYWLSLLAAALAIAVRDIAIAFVLLWFVYSSACGRWREASLVGGLIAAFVLGMYGHYLNVEAVSSTTEPVSQGWTGLAGYSLPIAAMVKLSFLQMLPPPLAAPLALLPLVGWLSFGGRTGLFAVLWFAGHATALALFARPENFYWMQLILPAYMIGFALAPRGIGELVAGTVKKAPAAE